MKRRAILSNERGLMLVEILAALVILGIVFVGFMTIFPQMTKFNEKTYSKLETMNLARKELDSAKENGLPSICSKEKSDICTIIKPNVEGYIVEIDYIMNPDLKPDNTSAGQITLFQIHIKIKNPNKEKIIISETFGYVEG
ncbi:type II secretion system protein [Sporosarcina sp. Sa2YVA2]|uniref:Type II secretion system protein n=1 Tax=Sporosarcina quadrami TaxID=2762234 RepID=A0ABR8U4Q3_9BACL|nr:type II secretion system protein [Sporosarcina quadrami]MBD7983020.1 type II secretion system protein [Sporosarcina quadrami]